MTEIVDDRQRLVAEARDHASLKDATGGHPSAALLRRLADQIEQDGKRLADAVAECHELGDECQARHGKIMFLEHELHKALASPSEGNNAQDWQDKNDSPGWPRLDLSDVGASLREAVRPQMEKLARAVSPSEGNKKGDAHTVADTGGGFYRVLDPQGDAVGTFISRDLADEYAQRCTARLASRPQEQPRKATGEMVEAMANLLREVRLVSAVDPDYENDHLTTEASDGEWAVRRDALLLEYAALSVSPAAAQGWQLVPIVLTETMEFVGAAILDHPSVYMGGPSRQSRKQIQTAWAKMIAAAPPAPAAQEQEKGEQT